MQTIDNHDSDFLFMFTLCIYISDFERFCMTTCTIILVNVCALAVYSNCDKDNDVVKMVLCCQF